ncbi:hypothetical protein BGW38_007995 [Lunasporangiospora selenospora]|uniref:Uncharacterized protein n=1 Tax=Lunasporangiospora selenospora TaxID=979761 RepID=A0A9P6FY14_9FUNG|nr:hypothetical protein BGW38_007995 [Lunasporangiospora selenospora]
MISLPRSLTLKVFVLLIVFCILAITLQYNPRPTPKDRQDNYHWTQRRPQQPVEGSKERVPLSPFKVPSGLDLTHDIATPHTLPPWTRDDTELLDSPAGEDFRKGLLEPKYDRNTDLENHPEQLDFAELSRAERVYKALWNHVYSIYQSLPGKDHNRDRELLQLAKSRPEVDLFQRLETRLYPWIHHGRQTSFSLYNSYKGKGLVFCVGNGQFEFAVTAILSLRNRLKSTLPIQIFHMGKNDLSQDRQQYLLGMAPDIEVIDVTQFLDNSFLELGGWAIKPFAMLASRFEEAMFVDADAYFLKDPAMLFEDPGYLATGALFFYDRTLFQDVTTGREWIKAMLPIMSSFPPKSRLFNLLSAHEQESGVVLINKKTRFVGLLASSKLNDKWERKVGSYKIFHGDKETFWIGFEMVQEPYAFMRNYGGVIGELRPGNALSVCGAQLHQDHRGRPLWWNGGLYRNKNAGVNRYLDFGYWMTGGGQQKYRERFTRDKEAMIQVLMDLDIGSSDNLVLEPKDAEWEFEESCLSGAEVRTLTDAELHLANEYVAIDRVAREVGQRARSGLPIDPKSHDWKAL